MVQLIRQRKIIIWSSVFLLFILSFAVLQPFIMALALGFTFAVALVPIKKFFINKFHIAQPTAATFVSILSTIFILGPIVFVVYKLIAYINSNAKSGMNAEVVENKFFNLAYSLAQQIGFKISKQNLFSGLEQVSASIQEFLLQIAKTTIASVPDTAVQLIVLFFTLFIVLINYKRFTFKTLDAVGISSDIIARINVVIYEVCKDVVFANILTGFIQAIMVTAGTIILTDLDPMLIFVITFVVSFIPVIGAAPVAIGLALYQFSEKNSGAAIALLILSVLVGISDNIVRAKLMARSKGENAFLNFLASIGGIYLWGLPGIFAGPLVVALSVRTIPLLLEELKPVAGMPSEEVK